MGAGRTPLLLAAGTCASGRGPGPFVGTSWRGRAVASGVPEAPDAWPRDIACPAQVYHGSDSADSCRTVHVKNQVCHERLLPTSPADVTPIITFDMSTPIAAPYGRPFQPSTGMHLGKNLLYVHIVLRWLIQATQMPVRLGYNTRGSAPTMKAPTLTSFVTVGKLHRTWISL